MKLRIENNKKYKIPCERLKKTSEWCLYEIAERERIDKMTQEEYEEYLLKDLEDIENIDEKELIPYEQVMTGLNESLREFTRENKNYCKWMRLINKVARYEIQNNI